MIKIKLTSDHADYTGENDRQYIIDQVEFHLTSGSINTEDERCFFRRELSILTKKELRQIVNADGSLNPIAHYVWNNLRQNYYAESIDDPSWRTLKTLYEVLRLDQLKGSGS